MKTIKLMLVMLVALNLAGCMEVKTEKCKCEICSCSPVCDCK